MKNKTYTLIVSLFPNEENPITQLTKDNINIFVDRHLFVGVIVNSGLQILISNMKDCKDSSTLDNFEIGDKTLSFNRVYKNGGIVSYKFTAGKEHNKYTGEYKLTENPNNGFDSHIDFGSGKCCCQVIPGTLLFPAE